MIDSDLSMWPFWETAVIEAVLTSALAVLSYIGKRGLESRSLKRELALTIIEEISHNQNVVEVINSGEGVIDSPVHTKIYEGIVSQGNIRYFDPTLQAQMHSMYDRIVSKQFISSVGLFKNILLDLNLMVNDNCGRCIFTRQLIKN